MNKKKQLPFSPNKFTMNRFFTYNKKSIRFCVSIALFALGIFGTQEGKSQCNNSYGASPNPAFNGNVWIGVQNMTSSWQSAGRPSTGSIQFDCVSGQTYRFEASGGWAGGGMGWTVYRYTGSQWQAFQNGTGTAIQFTPNWTSPYGGGWCLVKYFVNTSCANAPSAVQPFWPGTSATISYRRVTGPLPYTASVNTNCWNTNGSNTYNITVWSQNSSDDWGGSYGIMALVNYQGTNAGSHGGYFSWNTSTANLNSGGYTLQQMAASGGGFVGKASGYGDNTVDLISASTGTDGGDGFRRWVTFTVRPNTNFTQQTNYGNSVSVYCQDVNGQAVGWNNYATGFSSTHSTISSVTAAANPVCGQGTTTLTANGTGGSAATVTWWTGANGTGNNLGTGTTRTVGPGQTYYARVTSLCATAEANLTLNLESTAPTISIPATVAVNNSPANGCRGSFEYSNGTPSDGCAGVTSTHDRLPSSGMVTWLLAGGGIVRDNNSNVFQWRDASGQNNHFYNFDFNQRPSLVSNAINGWPVVRFTTNHFLRATNDLTGSDYSIFYISKTNGASQRVLSSANSNMLLGYWSGRQDQYHIGGWVSNPGTTAVVGQVHMYAATRNAGGSTFYDFGNVIATGGPGTELLRILQLNGWNNGLSETSNCDIAEVIVYNRILSTAERQIVEGYLARKYNVQAPIASMQAYQSLSVGNTSVPHYAIDASGNKTPPNNRTHTVNSYPGPTLTASNTLPCAEGSTTVTVDGMAPNGNTLNCSGSAQYVNLPTTVPVGSSWTLESWIKFPLPANTGSWNTLFRGTSFHHIIFDRGGGGGNGRLGVYTGAGFIPCGYNFNTTGSGLSSGWHHIAAVGNGGNTDFYIDGMFVGRSAGQPTDNIATLGNFSGGGQHSGEMDDIRIWNTALPQNTINQWMTRQITSSHPNWGNMQAYYRFNGNYNDSKNSYNGTAINGPSIAGLANYYSYTLSTNGGIGGTVSPAGPSMAETFTISNFNASTSANQPGNILATATANSCNSAQSSSAITVSKRPSIPTVGGSSANFSVSFCGSGQITATPDEPGNTCRWYRNGVSNGVAPNFLGQGTTSPVINTSGTYFITSYNGTTGCEGTSAIQVTVTITPSFTLTTSTSNYNGSGVSCVGSTNGSITANCTSTSFPITYTWSNGVTNVVYSPTTSNTITGLAAGTYTVSVNDAGACGNSATVTLTSPPSISSTLTPSNFNGFGTNCNGSSTGSITTSASGGTGSLSYSWTSTPSGFTSLAMNPTGLTARTYNLTITDQNGCTATNNVVIDQPAVITFTTNVGYVCSGSNYTSASITVNASGGASGTYQYSRDGGSTWQTSNIFSGLPNSSSHNIRVRDLAYNTCLSGTTAVNITFPAAGTAVGDCNFIYVSPSGDPTGTLGTKACPASLLAAISIFNSNPSRNHILMASGTYGFGTTINIPGGLTIDGGYNETTWIKSSGTPTILNINPTPTDNAGLGTSYYIGLNPSGNNFVLKDLTINVQTGGASGTYQGRGRSVFGVYIGGRTGWTISRCQINTGAASAGADGAVVSGAGGGGSGANGGSGNENYPSGCGACGNGGASGASASGAGGGFGGGGGGGGGCCAGGCNWYGCDAGGCTASNGGNGQNGADGTSYAFDNRPSNTSGIQSFYVPVNGAPATQGLGGGGGGQGGTGGSGTCCTCDCGPFWGTGGYGGRGGDGGKAGNFGYGGGSSIGIYAWGGSGTVISSGISPGAAGNGGRGSNGTSGTAGATGTNGGDNSGYCDGGKGGRGGNGGNGGNGGRGQDGSNGISAEIQSANGASISRTGGTTVATEGTLTADWKRGCTKSEIILTKTTGSSWNSSFVSSSTTDPAFINDITSSSTSYNNTLSSIAVFYPGTTVTGNKNIIPGSTSYVNFIQIYQNRIVDPTSTLISSITAPCPDGNLTLTSPQAGNTNIIEWDWKISNVSSPTTYVYSSTSPSPGSISPPSGGWSPSSTYQVRLRVREECCGWSIPVYATFTIPNQLAQVSTITQTPSTTICANQTGVTYTASTVSGATSYDWTISGGSIVSGQGTATITVNWGAPNGSAFVSVVPKNACTPGTDGPVRTRFVHVNGLPAVNIVGQTTTTFCHPGSVILQANTTSGAGQTSPPGSGTGTFPTYVWSPGGSGSNTLNVSPSSAGTYNYTVTVTEGGSGCSNTSSAITVTVNAPPTVNVGGAMTSICQGATSAALGGSFGGTATGAVWSDGGAGGTFANNTGSTPNTATYTASASFFGTVTLTLTSQGGPCSAVSATKNITVNQNPTVNVGGGLPPICQGGTTVVLGGTFGGGATGAVWSDGGAGGTFTNNGGSSPSTATYTASTTAPTIVTLTLTSTGGTCGSVSSSKNLTVNPLPIANAGGAVSSICQGGTTAALGGSVSGGATAGIWSDGGAGGTFTNNSGSTPNTTTYTASSTSASTVTLTLTASGGLCGTASASKTLTVNPNPTVNVGGAVNAICQGGTTIPLGGSFGGGATSAVWSDGGAGGTFSNNGGTTPGTATYTASSSSSSPVVLTLTTSGGSCGTVSANKNLVVNVNPTINAGSAIPAVCQGGTTAALGGTFGGSATAAVWSDGGAGGTFTNNSGSTPASTTYTSSLTSPNNVTLTLTTSGGLCGTLTATKILTVNSNPTVNAGGGLSSICQGGTTTALGGSFGGGATGAVWNDGGAGGVFSNNGGTTPGTATYTASTSSSNSVVLTLTTTGGACGTVSSSKNITVTPSPTVNVGGAIPNICQSGTTIALGGTFGGSAPGAIWSDGGAGGVFSNNTGSTPQTATYTASASAPSTVTLTLTSQSGPCGTTNSSKTVSIDPTSVGGAVTGGTSICIGGNTGTLTLSGNVGTVVRWERQHNGGGFSNIGNGGNNTYSETPSIPGIWQYRAIVQSGVCSQASSVATTVVVSPVSNGGTLTNTGSSSICLGLNIPNLALSGFTGGITNWEYSINGGSYISVGTTANPFSMIPTVGGNYNFRAVVTSGACASSNSTPVAIFVNDACDIVWLGGVSTDWHTAANWDVGVVPTSLNNVTIPDQPNDPIVSVSNGQCRNILVASAVTLSVTANRTLSIHGISATFNNNTIIGNGTVAFSSNTNTTLNGPVFLDVLNTYVTGSTNLNIQGPAQTQVRKILKVDGTVQANNKLLFVSTNNGTGLIDGSGVGNISGIVEAHRFVAGGNGYRYLSTPLNGVDITQWSDDIPIMGQDNFLHDGITMINPWPNLWRYDETLTTPGLGWISYTALSPPHIIDRMKGYAMIMYSTTLDVAGTVVNGNQSTTITRTTSGSPTSDGWNLLGNPYLSPINWNTIYSINTGISPTVYRFNNSNSYSGNYATYNALTGIGSPAATSPIIASSQGFMILKTTAGSQSFQMTNAVRTTDVNPQFFKTENDFELIRLEVKNGDKRDEVVLMQYDGSTNGYDDLTDALKLRAQDKLWPTLFIVGEDNSELTINALPKLQVGKPVPLGFKPGFNGIYNFEATELQNIKNGYLVLLEDRRIGKKQILNYNPIYSFSSNQDEPETGRFYLNILKESDAIVLSNEENGAIVSINNIGKDISIEYAGLNDGNGVAHFLDILGKEIHTPVSLKGENGEIKINFEGLANGIYIVKVLANGVIHSKKVMLTK